MPQTSGQEPLNDNQQTGEPEVRIGVYVCYCGGNISSVVDCEGVAETLSQSPGVVVARTDMSMCSDIGQSMIEEDIKNHGVNRVVIGACAPSLHEQTFRETVKRAGLNPYFYHHVGIREQASWVHHEDPVAATNKVIRLMRAGIAKARLLEPLESIQLTAQKRALVNGGGVAGLRCAWDMARRGLEVVLVEKSPFLGGHIAQLESTFPNAQAARPLLDDLIQKVVTHPKIDLHLYSQVTDVSGVVGDYRVQITQNARGVDADSASLLMESCQDEVPDPFNYGLTKRKVIYTAYPGCYPELPAVDWSNCPADGIEVKSNGSIIKLQNQQETIEVSVGAVVVATGFEPYQPPTGELGYGQSPYVLTLPEFIRWMALKPEGEPLSRNGKKIGSVGFVHCVGSRQVDGVHTPQADGEINPYCSRVCCTATLQAIHELHQRQADINIVDLYQDIRTYGRGHEDFYTQASSDGVLFVRYLAEKPPQVEVGPDGVENPIMVRVEDTLTWGEELEIPVDMLVLAVGMMPSPITELSADLKINPGTDRFLQEVHPKLRPVETAVAGVVLAGTAQGPMNIQESVAAASAAAAKVAVLLGEGRVELEPFVARVDLDKCVGAGDCVEVCAYEDAIQLVEFSSNGNKMIRAQVTPANCVGCGACVSACAHRAIDVQGWTLDQFEAMVEAITLDVPALEVVRE
jgi:heterodisulfide reductase subunit A